MGGLEKAAELEVSAKTQLAEIASKTADLQQHVDESKNREAQLRAQNKVHRTLRNVLKQHSYRFRPYAKSFGRCNLPLPC